jgi:CRISPR system Cascade subunit CasA
VLLHPARGPHGQAVVDRVLIGAGEVLELDPDRDLQDAAYVTTAAGPKLLWPSPTRAQWRDAHALYSAVMKDQTGLYARLRSLPHERKGPGAPYQMWAVGLLANKTLPVAWIEGAYPYAPALTRHLYRASYRGSEIAEYLASSLRRAAVIASETAYPAMRPADGSAHLARFDGRWEFWPAASVPFYSLLDEVVEAGAVDEDDPVSAPLIDYAQILLDEARAHLAHRLDSLPPNDRGNRARARAQQRFEDDVNSDKAPAELRGETAHD